MDLYGDINERDEINPFVQLLWEKGSVFEKELISKYADDPDFEFIDLSMYKLDEKEQKTLEAMDRGVPLIYSARIQQDGLLGDPDLLRKEGEGYIAGDIKSGAALEGGYDTGSPKKHYAVQLALYTDILERKGWSPGRYAFVWDINRQEVLYDLAAPNGKRNPRSFWEDYLAFLDQATQIVADTDATLPAASAACKLCYWYSSCRKRLVDIGDLTLIPELGRSKRDAMIAHIPNLSIFAAKNPTDFVSGKKTLFPGVGPDSLAKFHRRALLLVGGEDAQPYTTAPIQLPETQIELFFDLEVDVMRDICYLHGFVERRHGDSDTERFVHFFVDRPEPDYEERAFEAAWSYIQSMQPCAIFYYSKYERTIYRNLQKKYPRVCSEEDIEVMFHPSTSIDLYFDVVKKATEWPTYDHSIKTLAKYLGFDWRDTHPSGAASIEWYDRWVKTGDPEVRQRILDYNEDDCIATRVLLDGIRGFM